MFSSPKTDRFLPNKYQLYTYLNFLVVFDERALLFVRESLNTGEEVGQELLVVGGEVDGRHEIDGGADLVLEEVV